MNSDKELFKKHSEKKSAWGNCDECGCGTGFETTENFLSEPQFLAALAERDGEITKIIETLKDEFNFLMTPIPSTNAGTRDNISYSGSKYGLELFEKRLFEVRAK